MRPEHVGYDVVDDHIGVITFRRPRAVEEHGARGAHHAQLLRELDDAWQTAAADSRARVIVLRSTGPNFFAGPGGSGDRTGAGTVRPGTGTGAGSGDSGTGTGTGSTVGAAAGACGGDHDWEVRQQLHYAQVWRDIPKPAVAAVQGRCMAGGVLLCSPCDLVVAADDAEFARPVTGTGGGPATADGAAQVGDPVTAGGPTSVGAPAGAGSSASACAILTAAQAQDLGLVTTVVPLAALHRTALALARDLGASR
ncbi:enoyl-CoA hydratase [Parafrankia irregularis]|uniref:Enoyl-CoA hydratase n=1 Tax=Parafrankia irregularis TaxID=795642 RepID=A0A0S4QRQ8_9ACTN|nr:MULTISPECIES: enoyl-CoA hydratase-related protein [Parafrankia]MBE3206205.1 hypothetical protein [Parafrankia sp. CH37]CUU57576.1 enoyl-CoA hydratase [Parafrankia irregularis]